jgi:FixJ family two-component response regulator
MEYVRTEEAGTWGSPVITVVDDDMSVRRAVSRLVQSVGLEVMAYHSAEEYLDAAQKAAGCLILDIHLDGMSGLELFEQLVSAGDAPPAIFVTADDTSKAREQAHELGALAYLRKPFDAEALLQAIGTAVGRDLESAVAPAE